VLPSTWVLARVRPRQDSIHKPVPGYAEHRPAAAQDFRQSPGRAAGLAPQLVDLGHDPELYAPRRRP
jgi:hypothetical protein